ncbi:MAG TPA: glycosyltransferase, partial [Chthonomonadales bacterium]|nr:glycosyltransferase [Chthonomonadales bacterium]
AAVGTLKIAMITSVGDRCGIAAYTRELITALRALPDTEVEVVPVKEGKQPREHYVDQADMLNAPDVDVVHIQHEHSFWGGVLPRTSAFWEMRYLIQKPVVLTAHTTYSLAELLRLSTERRPHKWLVKKLLTLNRAYRESVDTAPFATAMTIVHTAAARKSLIERGINDKFVTIVPTGIPEPHAAPTGGASFKKKWGLQNKRVVTLFGYIDRNKGYELTLQVLANQPEDVAFVIAGGARNEAMEPYRRQVEAAIAGSRLQDRVTVTGYLTEQEVAEAMEASDIVVAPHTFATGSYSVTLPLSHGRPVLASDVDCFKEISARIDCIELFRCGNAGDYSAKLAGLLANEERRGLLSANAVRYACRFSWPKVAGLTRDVYKSAIQVYSRRRHSTPHAAA